MASRQHPVSFNSAESDFYRILLEITAPASPYFVESRPDRGELSGLYLLPANMEMPAVVKSLKDANRITAIPWADLEEHPKQADFLYAPFLFSHFVCPGDQLEWISRSLKQEAWLFIEDLDFLELNCFPHSHAFERMKELFAQVTADKRDPGRTFIQRIEKDLVNSGFEPRRAQFRSPTFLRGQHKKFMSLFFERFKGRIVSYGLAGTSEMQTLMTELRTLESLPDTMVSLPGLYQIKSVLAIV